MIFESRKGVVTDVNGTLQYHEAGDQRFYFGDEPVLVGQPKVTKSGTVFFLERDTDGDVVLHEGDGTFALDSSGNVLRHRKGEPVYLPDGTIATYNGGEPRLYQGGEGKVYFGGELARHANTDPVLILDDLNRVPAMMMSRLSRTSPSVRLIWERATTI